MAREMRDSGIEWIGEIPVEWSVERNKGLFFEVNERCEHGDEYTLLSVSEYSGITPRTEIIDEGEYETHATTLDGYKICKINDIVMNIMLAWKRATARSDYEGIVSPAYCIYRAKREINTKYFHYLFRTDGCADMFKRFSTGIIDSRLRLYPNVFMSLNSIVPPLDEQNSIVNYLDSECAHIDAVIEQTRASIEEYKKLKQAVITQAVTKGIRPDRPMKDSGYSFLGCISCDVSIARLKNVVEISDGTHDTPDYVDVNDDTFPLVTSRCIVNGRIDETLANHISRSDYEQINMRSNVQKYDVIMPMIGTVGNPALVESDGNFAIKNVALFRTNGNRTLGRYIVYILDSDVVKQQFAICQRGGVQNFVSQDMLKNIYLPLHNDLNEIVDYLDQKCQSIDDLITKKEKAVEELESYKKSLIYEYVTGKKEVPS